MPAGFLGRDLLVFLAFRSIFATLILQETMLGWVVRRLDVVEPDDTAPEPELVEARAEIADAALDAVKARVQADGQIANTAAAVELICEYEVRAERASIEHRAPGDKADRIAAQHRLRLVAIEASRSKFADHTDQVEVEAHRALIEELDMEEQQIRSALGEEAR